MDDSDDVDAIRVADKSYYYQQDQQRHSSNSSRENRKANKSRSRSRKVKVKQENTLDSLDEEFEELDRHLAPGEQYFMDLAGNIRKVRAFGIMENFDNEILKK